MKKIFEMVISKKPSDMFSFNDQYDVVNIGDANHRPLLRSLLKIVKLAEKRIEEFEAAHKGGKDFH